MEFKGRIYKVFPVTEGTSQAGKHWRKQEFIFEYFEREIDRWSDKVVLSAMNERIDDYDIHEGDEVKIGFGHSVNEYNGRWYNQLSVYNYEKLSKAAQEPAAQPQTVQPQVQSPIPPQPAQEGSKLPF